MSYYKFGQELDGPGREDVVGDQREPGVLRGVLPEEAALNMQLIEQIVKRLCELCVYVYLSIICIDMYTYTTYAFMSARFVRDLRVHHQDPRHAPRGAPGWRALCGDREAGAGRQPARDAGDPLGPHKPTPPPPPPV